MAFIHTQRVRSLLSGILMLSGCLLFVPHLPASDTTLEALRQEAWQGNADAQCRLALKFRMGDGVPQDYGAAAMWYKKAAGQGSSRAQYLLGRMYDDGEGVPRDYPEAFRWYTMAAEQGYVAAQGCLGSMYYAGQGIPQDFIKAYAWANLGTMQGDPETTKMRDDLLHRMTPRQIAEAQKLSAQLQGKIATAEE